MLRITQQSDTAAAKGYYAAADYFADGPELAGEWGGTGARWLGLTGMVEKADFEALCENRDPNTGRTLTARRNTERTVGYDFTWSVPKSVSLAYGLTQDEGLVSAFRTAVNDTMQEIEAEMKVRVRKGSQNHDRVSGNAAWATFVHTTARPVGGVPDPHLHAHCFVFSASLDRQENVWKAGQFRDLKRDAPYWQAAFRARLAQNLQARGYALDVSQGKGDFELAGLSRSTMRKFSRRTAQVEHTAEDLGITDPTIKSGLGATTREGKRGGLTWDDLKRDWDSRLTPAERETITAARAQLGMFPSMEPRDTAAVEHAVAHLFERQSVVPVKSLLAEALRHGLGAVTPDGVQRAFARTKPIVREIDGRSMTTTTGVAAEERAVLDYVREGRGTCRPLAGFDRPLSRPWLDAGQQAAVRHIWESPDRVILIRGAAGTGKTTLLKEAVEGLQSAGRPVVALAPGAEASRKVLRSEVTEHADTVARFLLDERFREGARHGVVLVDEASLLGTPTLHRLFAVSKELDARVVLVGDVRQHTAVERGDGLRLLETEAGARVVAVSDIRRQQNGRYRAAVQHLSDGRVLAGFDALDRLGWVKERPDADRYQELAADYLALSARGSVLVVAPTNAEKDRATAAVRDALRAAGKLGEERVLPVWESTGWTTAEKADPRNYAPGDMLQFHQNARGFTRGSRVVLADGQSPPIGPADRYQVYHSAELPIAVGDRLRVTAGGKTTDGNHRLNTGWTFTLTGFTKGGDLVADNGWVIGRDFGHLAHGVATTSWSSQGKTVDHVLVAQSSASRPAVSLQQFYVSASRGKHSLTVYTDAKEDLRDAIARSEQRLTATELLRHRRPSRVQRHLAFLRRAAAHLTPSVPRPAPVVVRPEMEMVL